MKLIKRKGFTIIELLVVIGVIAILTAIIFIGGHFIHRAW